MRAAIDGGVDAGVVLCGKKSAYIDRRDRPFVEEVDRYYARLRLVDDLLAVRNDDILKVSVFDFGSAEHTTAPPLANFVDTHLVTVSGAHWVDITSRTANKGRAVQHIQQTFGITRAQTMVFGDFLNDLEMMGAADYSFAMFVAFPLYLVHAVLTGLSLAIAYLLDIHLGFSFSAGLIDLLLYGTAPAAKNIPLLILMGVGFFVVYYLLFRLVIRWWNLPKYQYSSFAILIRVFSKSRFPSSSTKAVLNRCCIQASACCFGSAWLVKSSSVSSAFVKL